MKELDQVIKGGYCIGCGACAAMSDDVKIIEDDLLQYQAEIKEDATSDQLVLAEKVCPFSNKSKNEDEICKTLFDGPGVSHDDVIGHYRGLYAGCMADQDVRSKATSGGIITWVLVELLKRGLVDGVIHVKKSDTLGTLFEYGISTSPEEVIEGAKSRYYPIEVSKVIPQIKEKKGRYAFVGLPCFVKAIRNICLQDPVINERIRYCVGLVCGHLKSKAFAEMLAWQGGVLHTDLKYVDFRKKLENRPADNYGIQVDSISGKSSSMVARECMGTNWGLGFFKYEACDYCDDIFSETADLAVGDAWLEKYTEDSKGNSVVVARNAEIKTILLEGVKNKELNLDVISDEIMREAQGGAFRHRRSGLGYRLSIKQKKGEWAPNKRQPINPKGISRIRKLVYILRINLREKSAVYWRDSRASGDYESFEKRMKFPTAVYKFLLQTAGRAKKIKKKILGKNRSA